MGLGFIGLGIMGSRMASNLLDAGHELVVYNRTRRKAEPLIQKGARWVDSPARLVEAVETVITMVSDPQAVEAVAFGQDGFLDPMQEGGLWIDCSTVNPSFSVRMALEAAERGVRFMDAPVAGSRGPAEEGQVLFLVGGNAADLEQAMAYFNAMGRKAVHVGEVGLGTGMKMLFNALLASTLTAFAEVAVLGEDLGIDRERVIDTLLDSPVAAPFLTGKRSAMLDEDDEVSFPLKWMHKDLHLASQTAYEQGTSMPVSNAAKEVYGQATRAGLGENDFAAVYRFLRRPAGTAPA